MFLLNNTIQNYAWGSHTALAELQRRPSPSITPEAELWMGAHPLAPSRIVDADADAGQEASLLDWIAAQPEIALGPRITTAFGELPFLLKILAAQEPLSLQVHPNLEQAAQGFARENAAKIPLSSPQRCYKDQNHKPELICALSPFWALCGFRELPATRELFALLRVPALAPFEALLNYAADTASALRQFTSQVLSKPAAELEPVLGQVVAAVEREQHGSHAFAETCHWAARIAQKYASDPGLLIALAMNCVKLEPGEALFLPAGNLHAYLAGTGIEIMASSDNVLRGGLTPKHVNVAELLRILDFNTVRPQHIQAQRAADGAYVYATSAREFELQELDFSRDKIVILAEQTPRVLVCINGVCHAASGTKTCELGPGKALFIPANAQQVQLSGVGKSYCARVPAP